MGKVFALHRANPVQFPTPLPYQDCSQSTESGVPLSVAPKPLMITITNSRSFLRVKFGGQGGIMCKVCVFPLPTFWKFVLCFYQRCLLVSVFVNWREILFPLWGQKLKSRVILQATKTAWGPEPPQSSPQHSLCSCVSLCPALYASLILDWIWYDLVGLLGALAILDSL